MTTSELRRDLRKLVAAGTGLGVERVIRSGSNGPAPDLPYVAFQLIDGMTLGTGASRFPDDGTTITEDVRTSHRDTYSLRFLGKGAHDLARNLRNYLLSERGLLKASEYGMSIHAPGSMRDLTAVPFTEGGISGPSAAKGFEERCAFELDIGYSYVVRYDSDAMESAEVQVSGLGESSAVTIEPEREED